MKNIIYDYIKNPIHTIIEEFYKLKYCSTVVYMVSWSVNLQKKVI